MAKNLKSTVSHTAKSAAPWRKGVPWWLVLIEGIILAGVGFYMFFGSSSTLVVMMGWIIALVLVAVGAISLYLVSQVTEQSPSRKFTMIHGLVAVGAGGLVILLRLLNMLLNDTAAVVLGFGCLVYGGMGLYTWINKSLVPLRRVSVIGAIFFLIIGALLMLQAFGMATVGTIVQFITIASLIAGIALIIWSFALKNSADA